jgi:hypothetical protein
MQLRTLSAMHISYICNLLELTRLSTWKVFTNLSWDIAPFYSAVDANIVMIQPNKT